MSKHTERLYHMWNIQYVEAYRTCVPYVKHTLCRSIQNVCTICGVDFVRVFMLTLCCTGAVLWLDDLVNIIIYFAFAWYTTKDLFLYMDRSILQLLVIHLWSVLGASVIFDLSRTIKRRPFRMDSTSQEGHIIHILYTLVPFGFTHIEPINMSASVPLKSNFVKSYVILVIYSTLLSI